MTAPCQLDHCDTPTPLHLCHTHTRHLAAAINVCATLLPDLHTRPVTRAAWDRGPRNTTPVIPYDARRAQLWRLIRKQAAHDLRTIGQPATRLPATDTQTLTHHTDELANTNTAPATYQAWTHYASRILDIVNPPTAQLAGPCPTCSRPVYSPPEQNITRCRGCGIDVDTSTDARHAAVAAAIGDDALVTARDAALAHPVTGQQIRQWVARGRLTPAGHDPGTGANLYRWREVDALARAIKTRGGTR